MNRSALGLALAAFLIVGVIGWIGGMPRAAELRSQPYSVSMDGTGFDAPSGDAETPGGSVSAAGSAAAPAVESATSTVPVTRTAFTIPAVDPAWTERVSASTAIPERALVAYAGAALAVSADDPGCGLGWNTLAAIGFVESAHGTVGGATLDDSGLPSSPVVGVPLDGIAAASIPDSDAGAIDGDAAVDRAVGPMQFIPDSWERHGVDGSGDGIADPHQIDDAALTAAGYLCVAGGDLGAGDGWNRAVLAYNNDPDYVAQVAAKADAYAVAAP